MSESIFVLDIGTRTVVALWASFREGAMYVEHILTKNIKPELCLMDKFIMWKK